MFTIGLVSSRLDLALNVMTIKSLALIMCPYGVFNILLKYTQRHGGGLMLCL